MRNTIELASIYLQEKIKAAEDRIIASIAHDSENFDLLKVISERERDLLVFRYKEKKSVKETCEKFGITRERVRQIERRAFDLLIGAIEQIIKPQCKTCIYFDSVFSKCHKNAVTTSGFPVVGSDDWCGEFVPSIQKTANILDELREKN